MPSIAIIGGSGLDTLAALADAIQVRPVTPYGPPSAAVMQGRLNEHDVCFIARHGNDHSIPPHKVNYRANIAALAQIGVTDILAVTAVGGMAPDTPPGRIVVPDQIVDYTYGREHTFSDGRDGRVEHIDFTRPYCPRLRGALIDAAMELGFDVTRDGVYGATQGPRLETAAEIRRMTRDGCTIVGMTGMPEASLARERGINYANCSLVVNWAAGIHDEAISLEEITRELDSGMSRVVAVVAATLRRVIDE